MPYENANRTNYNELPYSPATPPPPRIRMRHLHPHLDRVKDKLSASVTEHWSPNGGESGKTVVGWWLLVETPELRMRENGRVDDWLLLVGIQLIPLSEYIGAHRRCAYKGTRARTALFGARDVPFWPSVSTGAQDKRLRWRCSLSPFLSLPLSPKSRGKSRFRLVFPIEI